MLPSLTADSNVIRISAVLRDFLLNRLTRNSVNQREERLLLKSASQLTEQADQLTSLHMANTVFPSGV